MVGFLWFIALVLLIISIVWIVVKLNLVGESRYLKEDEKKKASYKMPALLGIVGIVLLVILLTGGIVEVTPIEIAVVENTVTGQLYTINSGTHVFPFTPGVIPMVTKIYKYDLRRQIINIGEPPPNPPKPPEGKSLTQIYGVGSTSNSPGQPNVYFTARGWATVNPERVVELHRRFGPTYLSSWVDQNWINILKAVQGQLAYDYVKDHRVELAQKVERELQLELLDDNGTPIVLIRQLAIPNYDYDTEINKYLQQVAEKEFQRQQQEQQLLINQKAQLAAQTQADTDYFVKKRAAEAEQAKLIAEAEGQAQSIKKIADAQAEANKVIAASITSNLLQYNLYKQWTGIPPTTIVGDTSQFGFLMNLPK